MPQTKKKGRPRLPNEQRKDRIVPFRCTEDLFQKLTAAAAESGRTLSQELEQRVAWSFGSESTQAVDVLAKKISTDLSKDLAERLAQVMFVEISKGKIVGNTEQEVHDRATNIFRSVIEENRKDESK